MEKQLTTEGAYDVLEHLSLGEVFVLPGHDASVESRGTVLRIDGTGLVVSDGTAWRRFETPKGWPSQGTHWGVGEAPQWNSDEVMQITRGEKRMAPARGKISSLTGASLIAALQVWAGLVCRRGFPGPEGQCGIPRDPLKAADHIECWADLVLDCACWGEGDWAPTAYVTRKDAKTRWPQHPELTWRGQMIEARGLTVSIEETAGPGNQPCATITWDSGTGRPSTFLGGVLGDLLDKLEVQDD